MLKKLTVASIFAAGSMAAQIPVEFDMKAIAENDSCSSVYLDRCGDDGDCCAPMKCLRDHLYHCQVKCGAQDDCKPLEDTFGPMHCYKGWFEIDGFCRKK